ncbi:glycosyltransferase [Pectobacterium quasiaquaticum]|uniref:Glycosyltransferase n=1 Tax=Pectobacterium quasiaquaticum TaxID=2774015 RepID=A0A9Q2I907_9GAMM|nr:MULTISPECIES: glycosyltransferase [Pectobacterium]MBN3063861.1 glycosyltransferase [Pectobacterium aquaticum]URG47840.1 glycosyltransferase [Pectobacterium quasiaquaticum]
MNRQKISIITLTYNNWCDLSLAIESVSQQKISSNIDIEYLIVDDGTKNFDYQYIYSLLKEKCPFHFRILQNENNIGTVRSFNNAIKNSNGEIIIPLSADDRFFDNNVVNMIAEKFQDPGVSLFTTRRLPVADGKVYSSLPRRDEIELFDSQHLLFNYILKRGNFISGSCTYYRKSLLERLGYFDESYRLLEDYPFYIKVLLNNITIHFLDIISIKYSLGGVSALGKRNPLLTQDFRRLYLYIISLDYLSVFWKRNIYFTKVLSFREKMSLKNIIIYPEQCIFLSCLSFLRIIKKYVGAIKIFISSK